MRRGCEPDLVVDDHMHGAARLVAHKAGQTETFRNNTLTGKGRVTVQQNGQHLGPVRVVQLLLFGAHFPQNDGVHCLKVRWVRSQGQVDGVAVEFTVRRGPKVIFHIARSIHIFGFERPALEFVENRAIGFAHHVCQDRQTTTVRHAQNDVTHTQRATAFDDLFQCRDQAFAAIQSEPFGAHVFDM